MRRWLERVAPWLIACCCLFSLTTITLIAAKPVDGAGPGQEFKLTVLVSPENGGTVQVDGTTVTIPFEQMYPVNQVVQLKAIPASGYYFVGWRDTVTDTTDTVSIEMNATKQATAVFALIRYQLEIAVNPEGGGGITIEPSEPEDGYPPGTQITLTAAASHDFEFYKWTGDISGKELVQTFVMDEDKKITANFTQKENLSLAWWFKNVGLWVGIAIIIGLSSFLIIRRIIIKKRIPKVVEPCQFFLLSKASYYHQIDTDRR